MFKVDDTGHETVLYSFCSDPNCVDGTLPNGALVRDSAGNLYGVVTIGGSSASDDAGALFKLTPESQ